LQVILKHRAFDMDLLVREEDNCWAFYMREATDVAWQKIATKGTKRDAQIAACRYAQIQAGKDDGRRDACEALLASWKEISLEQV